MDEFSVCSILSLQILKKQIKKGVILMKVNVMVVPGLVFLMVLLQFAYLSAQDGNQLLLQGLNGYFSANYEQSVQTLEQVLEIDEENLDALYYQTLSYIKLNNVTGVRENISRLDSLGYQFGFIHWKLGKVYLNEEGQFDSPFYNEARKEFEKASELGIDSPRFHSDLGMAYQGLGELNKAAEEYSKALDQNAEIGDYINLAALYKETGQLEKAISAYQEALKINPTDNPSIYLNLGNIYLQLKDYDSAIDILEKGVAIDPGFVAIKDRLALAYYRRGDYIAARERYLKIIKQNDNLYEPYYYLGDISYHLEGNIQEAVYYYNEAIRRNPDYVKAYLALGNIYLKQENPYKAIAQFTTAIEKNCNYPDGHYYLALAYYELDMTEAAIAELRKTLHLTSDYQEAEELLTRITGE
jgi:tetratricopeptide (TPR) repeat protein